VAVAACAPPVGTNGSPASASISLYSSVTQDTVDAVLAVVAERRPDLDVKLFRAPTGELDARLAAERRSGGIRADVLWATDPLSVQAYDSDGLLAELDPSVAGAVPAGYRTPHFVGTRLLNLVLVVRADLASKPASWLDLAEPALRGRVAIPDPGFAGSAFAALAWFATAEGYGMDFYRRLKDNGAIQVASIGDVITGVAEGRYDVGISLDKSIRDVVARGSPIELVWPEPGAIALYSPIAIFASSDAAAADSDLLELVLSTEAQQAIAATGWQPIREDVEWANGGPTVAPDWNAVFGRQQELLEEYRTIFGG
jgi:iron(III) transport system substrate-binding protein